MIHSPIGLGAAIIAADPVAIDARRTYLFHRLVANAEIILLYQAKASTMQ
jgi:hypothetical protein